jgi:drug/metabolite transporter (DMT)-like permease
LPVQHSAWGLNEAQSAKTLGCRAIAGRCRGGLGDWFSGYENGGQYLSGNDGVRATLSAFGLLLLPFSLRGLGTLSRQTFLSGLLLGLLLGTSFVFLIYGLQLTTASNTGFLAGLSVIWVLLLTGPLMGKRPSFDAILATLFGLAGLYLMADIQDGSSIWEMGWSLLDRCSPPYILLRSIVSARVIII